MELTQFLFIVIIVLFVLLVIVNNKLKKCEKKSKSINEFEASQTDDDSIPGGGLPPKKT
jgi:hypothetical protein